MLHQFICTSSIIIDDLNMNFDVVFLAYACITRRKIAMLQL